MEDISQKALSTKVAMVQNNQDSIFVVKNEPVMMEAINVVSLLGKTNKAIIKAKGDSIPNAVAIANIVTEKFLKGNSHINQIIVDSETPEGFGRMISTIEIILLKN